MSWYMKAMGVPSKVSASLAVQFQQGKCAEPEETARCQTFAAMMALLGAMDDKVPVLAFGRGSQTQPVVDGPIYGEIEMRVELLNSMLVADAA